MSVNAISRHPEYYNVIHALYSAGVSYRYLMDIFQYQPKAWRVWALVKE